MLGSSARSWIDPHPAKAGGSATYTVVAVNRFDRAGPASPPAAGSVSAPADKTGDAQSRTWETHPLDRDRTPLLLAADAGHADVVEALLAAGADPAAIDAGGRTALHLAAARGHLAVAERLIAAHTPLDAVALGEAGLPERLFVERPHPSQLREAGAHTALSSVYYAHRDDVLFRLLLAAGANPALGPKGALAPQAASLGREEDLERLLKAGPHPFVTDVYGHTVFTAALGAGRLQLARRLREQAFDPAHPSWPAESSLSRRAFETAIRRTDLETVQWLRSRGATLTTAKGERGDPLLLAVESQAPAALIRELLFAGADPQRLNSSVAAKVMDPEVRALLKAPTVASPAPDNTRSRIPFPLSANPRSALHGSPPENRWLDPRAGETSAALRERLHQAAAAGDEAGLRAALSEGAWIDAPDRKGWTALVHALNARRVETARFLIDSGASLNRVTGVGSSPLCFAVGHGLTDLVDEMLDLGADPNLFDFSSGSPLTIALDRGPEIAARLLARGADPRLLVEMKGIAGEVPPLFVFARRGNLAAVKWLVDHDVDPTKVLWRGQWAKEPSHRVTALPFAAASNDPATLNYFLALGLDPALTDAYGDNALDTAIHAKADRSAARLRALGVRTRAERGLPPRHG